MKNILAAILAMAFATYAPAAFAQAFHIYCIANPIAERDHRLWTSAVFRGKQEGYGTYENAFQSYLRTQYGVGTSAHCDQKSASGTTHGEAVAARDSRAAYKKTLVTSTTIIGTDWKYGSSTSSPSTTTTPAATKALIDAAASGSLAALRRAIREGADINARRNDREGATALMWAAYRGDQAKVRALLEAGADVYATDKQGENAIDEARTMGHDHIVAILQAHR